MSFADSPSRLLVWNLERQLDGGWEITHILATGTAERGPTWLEEAPGVGLMEVARDGPGPDLLVLPDELPGGTYRITQGAEGDDEVRLEGPPFSLREPPIGG